MGGSYLSRPVKETVSELKSNDKLSYGASSMQGWRVRQEDAHNCILDFDDDVSFFAVYDGHGGSEVAVYTSQELPKFVKTTEKYKSGYYKEALIDAFLGFDDTIPSQEVLDKLKDIRDQELMDNRAKSQERRNRLRSSTGGSIDEVEEEEEDEEVEEESEDEEEDEFESAEVLLREACRPVEEVVAAYKQGTSVSSSSDGAGSSSSAGCSSSFLGESSSSFVDGGVGSSSAGSSSAAGSSCAASSSSGSSSVGVDAACSSQSSSSRSAASSSKISKDENLANGSVDEEAVMNGVLSNGDLSDELKEEKLPKRIPKGPVITINDQPGTSPKKKKLALSDLDDSTVVKNFIANDEISENDEDDSEDETFEISNDLDNDEENDDDDDDDDEDDSDSETPKTEFVLNRNSLVQQLTKHLRRNHGIIVEDSDDSEDDDADESVGEEDESANEAKSGEDDEDEGSIEEEDVEAEEESDNDEESIDIFSDGEQPGVDSGCTAVVALIKGDDLYVANAGDSRCVLCKNGTAVEMSEDHKPEDELECARVEKAGGRVSGGRVDGGLNLSRAIGDHRYKKNTELPNTEQMITALPDVRVAKLEPDVEFIVLACDGIWNSLSSQDVVNFIRPRIKSNKSLSEICEELFHECLAPNTMCDGTGCDNMTCIIVKPRHGAAANDAASNVADSESQVSNSVDGASSAAEKDAPSDAHSSEPAQNVASENHQADKPLVETTFEPAEADVPMEEGVACSRNLKRPNDSSDDVVDVASKRCKTDDVSVDDSSCVDTTSV